ncbi:Ig-like domain repeat protein [Pseudokineococcus basanitobsidens]|uniref:Ig-like domain repeat protein n=1 Tax=Pseudokineococcus basanitobsidens TaxID=1926649 RepID=A0ABU8RNV7_9ACTN
MLRTVAGSAATLALDATPTAQAGGADLDRALPAGQVWRSASGGVEVRTRALTGGRVEARISLARTGETHDALATTTTVEDADLARGRTTVLRGTVAVAPGAVTPQGSVTVDVAGARATAPVGADGTFAVEATPVLGGEQTLRAEFVPADAAHWAASTTSRAVTVADDRTSTGVTATATTAAGGPPDAATPAVLDVRLDGAGAVDGTVVVSEDGERLASAAVADGGARVELPVLPGGEHRLLVAYDGGSAASPGATTLALDVARVASSTAVSVTTAPTASRAGVLQARLSSAVTPAGPVEVRLGERVLASGTASDAGTRLALPVLPVDAHDLVVAFAGDRSVAPSRTSLRLVVAKDVATLEVVPPKTPTTAGGQVVVARVRAGGAAATGVVRLVVDGRTSTSAELVRGEVRLALPRLPAGRRTVTVSYDGSGTALPVAQALRVDVVRAAGTTTAKPATTSPARGRTTTLAVTVTSPAGTPTGDVVLRDDRGRALARGTLSGGRVTLTQPALRRGTYRFVVEHAGDAATAPSRSATWTVRVR